ncbi:MAG: DUF1446 domain-containing protein [Candidatus Hydrogenedentes bacterium]|nr:DUF1446 domain-containing protein [Candidatus Hydrogenedentota bacterium]
MASKITIGNAQGFWGDSPDAPANLLRQFPELDYLTLDYLAEVSLSILALQRSREPETGYARDFPEVLRSLMPLWKTGCKTRIVCNAGGLNPEACARACLKVLAEAGVSKTIGVVTGDNVLPLLQAEPGDALYRHWETGASVSTVIDRLMTANAYIGAPGVCEALDAGADIVLTGRVADPSLAVGIAMHAFGWRETDYEKLAAATVAGHVLECGTQACGGISTHWLDWPDPANMGFPYVELHADGAFTVTKPAGTGGAVNLETVKEQLLYEIGDPVNYLSPDCRVDFTALQLKPSGPNRVTVSGVAGFAPTDRYKVSATYRDGYWAQGALTIFGRDAVTKARRCGEIVLERLARAGYTYERHNIECLGANAVVAGVLPEPPLLETVLRISVADPRKEAIERFAKEIAPLVTSGPQGTTGYAGGRPKPTPVFAYWPCFVAKNQVHVQSRPIGPEGDTP